MAWSSHVQSLHIHALVPVVLGGCGECGPKRLCTQGFFAVEGHHKYTLACFKVLTHTNQTRISKSSCLFMLTPGDAGTYTKIFIQTHTRRVFQSLHLAPGHYKTRHISKSSYSHQDDTSRSVTHAPMRVPYTHTLHTQPYFKILTSTPGRTRHISQPRFTPACASFHLPVALATTNTNISCCL